MKLPGPTYPLLTLLVVLLAGDEAEAEVEAEVEVTATTALVLPGNRKKQP